MSEVELVKEKAKAFDPNGKDKKKLKETLELVKKFNERYPWRFKPELIDSLTSKDLYNPGHPGYFFHWIEHKLQAFGHIYVGHAGVWENAADCLNEFKSLLKIAVDDTKSLYQKIDATWGNIKMWGGDRIYAKKIVNCFYPEIDIYAFKTEDLERFCEAVGISQSVIDNQSNSRYGEVYGELTIGKKYEILNGLLLGFKNSLEETKDWHNTYFAHFLYSTFHDRLAPRAAQLTRGIPSSFKPLIREGLLFEPRTEQEVLYIFARHHRELGFTYIKSIRPTEFPDVIALDDRGDEKKIELELFSSEFESHKNSEGCDYIVCWINDTPSPPPKWPQIIALKEVIE